MTILPSSCTSKGYENSQWCLVLNLYFLTQ
uniref:Uncharacterized protein n=1 Tax=Arundo donax TaxID=35708 RepID=A0A0A8YFD8_ARUDO